MQIGNYYSHDYPIGLWSGPHSEVLHSNYKINVGNYRVSLMYLFSKRGEIPNQLLENAYNDEIYYSRYSNIYERKDVVSINVERKFSKRIKLNIIYKFINWENAGFSPLLADQYYNNNLNDIIKNAIILNISYNGLLKF